MKKAKILLLLLMCSMYQSCSSNEGNLEPQKEPQENFLFKDEFETFDESVLCIDLSSFRRFRICGSPGK